MPGISALFGSVGGGSDDDEPDGGGDESGAGDRRGVVRFSPTPIAPAHESSTARESVGSLGTPGSSSATITSINSMR